MRAPGVVDADDVHRRWARPCTVLGDALRRHRITKTLNYFLHIAATDTHVAVS